MRIRQVKPSFWTDPVVAQVSYQARLFYIGLWNVADDDGWLSWKPTELGALLFPYESPSRREKHIEAWAGELVAAGRVKLLDCGCARIPTLPVHQKHAGGNRSYQARDAHQQHGVRTSPDKSVLVSQQVAGTVGNGRERKGTLDAPAGDGSKNPESDDGITRALTVLQNPTASASMKEAAKAQLDRLGYVA